MKKVILELVFTVVIGFWVMQRLIVDIPSYVEPGWHTTQNPKFFLYVKSIFIILTLLFFLYRTIKLIFTLRQIIYDDRD